MANYTLLMLAQTIALSKGHLTDLYENDVFKFSFHDGLILKNDHTINDCLESLNCMTREQFIGLVNSAIDTIDDIDDANELCDILNYVSEQDIQLLSTYALQESDTRYIKIVPDYFTGSYTIIFCNKEKDKKVVIKYNAEY